MGHKATRIVIPKWGTNTMHVKEGEKRSKAGARLRVGRGGMNRIMVHSSEMCVKAVCFIPASPFTVPSDFTY